MYERTVQQEVRSRQKELRTHYTTRKGTKERKKLFFYSLDSDQSVTMTWQKTVFWEEERKKERKKERREEELKKNVMTRREGKRNMFTV